MRGREEHGRYLILLLQTQSKLPMPFHTRKKQVRRRGVSTWLRGLAILGFLFSSCLMCAVADDDDDDDG